MVEPFKVSHENPSPLQPSKCLVSTLPSNTNTNMNRDPNHTQNQSLVDGSQIDEGRDDFSTSAWGRCQDDS